MKQPHEQQRGGMGLGEKKARKSVTGAHRMPRVFPRGAPTILTGGVERRPLRLARLAQDKRDGRGHGAHTPHASSIDGARGAPVTANRGGSGPALAEQPRSVPLLFPCNGTGRRGLSEAACPSGSHAARSAAERMRGLVRSNRSAEQDRRGPRAHTTDGVPAAEGSLREVRRREAVHRPRLILRLHEPTQNPGIWI